MKQINKVARMLKSQFAGRYNDYYKSAVIYLDTADDVLYCKLWGQGESYIQHPRYLVPLVTYSPMYGNWGDEYGNDNNWRLTKKAIARDIKASFAHIERGDDYFPPVAVPEWLRAEVDSYTNR